MVVRRGVAVVAIIVGSAIVGGAVFIATDILPGLSLGAASGLLPSWAVGAQVSHIVATLVAPMETSNVGTVVAALDRFAASHGFVRDGNQARTVQQPDPSHLDLFYTSPRANLSFYTAPGTATLAVVSEPGRNDDLTSLINEVQSTFAPLGFTMEHQP